MVWSREKSIKTICRPLCSTNRVGTAALLDCSDVLLSAACTDLAPASTMRRSMLVSLAIAGGTVQRLVSTNCLAAAPAVVIFAFG